MPDITAKIDEVSDDWVQLHDPEGLRNLGGLGGFFSEGMRWKDFLERYKKEYHPQLEAMREAVVREGLWIHGSEHQDTDESPITSDGYYMSCSFRCWGDFMAAVWSEHYDIDYSYMSFYCTTPDKPVDKELVAN